MRLPARRAVVIVLGVCAALYLAALLALALGQRKILYLPYARVVEPAAVGLPRAQILRLPTDDGETLLAWFVAPARGRPLILYFHGNANGLADRGERFRALTSSGDGLLAVEYRGYPGSTGAPTERGLLIDGETAYAKALALGIPADRIVAMGESLGSGVAVDLAMRHEVGAVALDSPYSSTADVAAAQYWMFPVRLLMRDQFHSDEKIGRVTAPLLIVHGSADRTIPIRFGERLFALANEPKTFMRIEGAGHLALGAVIPKVLAWIDQALAQAPP
ncbi:MAG: alpha/beta hydrolase [Roseiarcus sp.]|jgi:fermentation-respiration switch protein FrsA (DUF1100 family)